MIKQILTTTIGAVAGVAVGAGTVGKVAGEAIIKVQNMSDKHLQLFLLMNQWVRMKQDGENLESYFIQHGYKKIAIYGLSYVGETLLNELKDSEVAVVYGIDKKIESIYLDVKIVSADEILEEVDAIVVTAVSFFDEIKAQLAVKVECPIISLEDILYDISKE